MLVQKTGFLLYVHIMPKVWPNHQ